MNPTKPPTRRDIPTGSGRFFRLTYSNSRPDDDPKLFKGRDGVAFCELTPVLHSLGYEYGTTIHLYPDDERSLEHFPRFQPNYILVLPTRPPLHDQIGIVPPRKIIRGAKTELEVGLFSELSKYFEFCTRKHVQLTKHASSLLRVDDAKKWAHVELYEYSGAEIMKHYVGVEAVKPRSNHRSSIAFFLRANNVPKVNCDFIASFGMDGYCTLMWNRLIRTRYPHWLATPGFVMAELIFRNPIPDKPITPEFVDAGDCVEVRILT